MAYCDLARTTDSLKFLCDKAFNIAKNQKYDEYKRGLSLMILWIFRQINKYQMNYTGQLLENFKKA